MESGSASRARDDIRARVVCGVCGIPFQYSHVAWLCERWFRHTDVYRDCECQRVLVRSEPCGRCERLSCHRCPPGINVAYANVYRLDD